MVHSIHLEMQSHLGADYVLRRPLVRGPSIPWNGRDAGAVKIKRFNPSDAYPALLFLTSRDREEDCLRHE